jgi:hypothetical protein
MMLPPFCFVTFLIDEVHLSIPDALPVDKFPSPVINASMEVCQYSSFSSASMTTYSLSLMLTRST